MTKINVKIAEFDVSNLTADSAGLFVAYINDEIIPVTPFYGCLRELGYGGTIYEYNSVEALFQITIENT